MKRSLLIFLLAAGCCLSAACGRAKNQGGGDAVAGNAKSANGGGGKSAATNPAQTDLVFAREAVEGLLDGDDAVADAFDWENLKVPGAADTGAAYREMPDDENREEFRLRFIEKFSESFEQSGASPDDLKNWREERREGERTTVAVDTTTGKTMRILVVRRDGRQLVSELSIE
jgi:predicted small secreted protein